MITHLGKIRMLQGQIDLVEGRTKSLRNRKEAEVSVLMAFLEDSVKELMTVYVNRRYAIQLGRERLPRCIVYNRKTGDYWIFDDMPIQAIEDIEANINNILEKVTTQLEKKLAERSNGQIGQKEMFSIDE